jgi:hypothetical protein
VLLFHARQDSRPANATVQMGQKQVDQLIDPTALTLELLLPLEQV